MHDAHDFIIHDVIMKGMGHGIKMGFQACVRNDDDVGATVIYSKEIILN